MSTQAETEHQNAIAMQMDLRTKYEDNLEAGIRIFQDVWDLDDPKIDPVASQLSRIISELSWKMEPIIPVEFNGYVVRSLESGYNVHLFDEDHNSISVRVGVNMRLLEFAFIVQCLRYNMFWLDWSKDQGWGFFHKDNEKYTDEELYRFYMSVKDWGTQPRQVKVMFQDWLASKEQ